MSRISISPNGLYAHHRLVGLTAWSVNFLFEIPISLLARSSISCHAIYVGTTLASDCGRTVCHAIITPCHVHISCQSACHLVNTVDSGPCSAFLLVFCSCYPIFSALLICSGYGTIKIDVDGSTIMRLRNLSAILQLWKLQRIYVTTLNIWCGGAACRCRHGPGQRLSQRISVISLRSRLSLPSG